jgi:hypothetical protein
MKLKEFILLETKKQLIESLFKNVDLNYLKSSDDPDEMIEYLKYEAGLPYYGKGSSRVVFGVSPEKVIKVAHDLDKDIAAGIEQNAAEVDVFTNPATKNIVAKVFDYHPDFLWIISERIEQFQDPVQYTNETGLSSSFVIQFLMQIKLYGEQNGFEKLKEEYESVKGSTRLRDKNFVKNFESAFYGNGKEFFNKLKDVMLKNDLMPKDFGYEHFGKTADGDVVLLDYGFTGAVQSNFYGS